MKKIFALVSLAAFVLVPSVARSQTSPTFGEGPNGYDYTLGTWSCANSMAPSATGAPAQQTLTVSKVNGTIFNRSTSNTMDFTSYNVYVPDKKMWLSPLER